VCELPSVTLKCGQGDCVRCYSTFNSLAAHLRAKHRDPHASFGPIAPDVDYSEPYDGAQEHHVRSAGLESGNQNQSAARDSKCAAAAFVASLMSSSSVTQKTVQTVIEHASALVSDIVDDISKDVVSILQSANVGNDAECGKLVDKLQEYRNPFESVNTQYNRDTYFHQHYGMVKGKSVYLGTRYDQAVDTVTGRIRPVIKRDTFQYVPILELLSLLLSDDSIFYECLQDHTSSNGIMYDFCDGELYKNSNLFAGDQSAIQLCLNFDECEVVNALGSRRGIHKIGFIYACLRNLRPVYNSCLSNIHIVAAFNTIDRSKYGFKRILAPLVRDLKQLEQGVDLRLRDGRVVHRRGTVVQVTGDNLGLNQLCGFVESFSAIHFCRVCTISRDDCDEPFRDDCLELRTKDQYSQQLEGVLEGTLRTRDCGIKTSCLLNDLQYFHITENITVDVMHDLLEGVVPFELKLILFHFIYDRKYFSLPLLNARLASFDYGFSDCRNKPTAIADAELRDPQKNTLTQKASQMSCLVRVLPFLIGDKVPEHDEMWSLYLLLRRIIDLAFADMCTVGDSIYLKYVIEDHHSLFRTLFPDRSMLPKHHLLLHYPLVMRRMGPLPRCSTIRFEAKHNESKRLCGIVRCFKDICKTVVHRHQLSQCIRIAAGNSASYKVSADRVSTCTVNELPQAECDVVLSSVAGLRRFDDVSHATAVSVCGTEYRNNMVLVVAADDEPQFCMIIRCLLVTADSVYFLCRDLRVKHFNSHMHAYVVEQGEGVRAVAHRSLNYYKPLCIRRTFNSTDEHVDFH